MFPDATGLTVQEVERDRPVSAALVAVSPLHGLHSQLRAPVSPVHDVGSQGSVLVSEQREAVSVSYGARAPVSARRFAMPVTVSSSHAGVPPAHAVVSNRYADVSRTPPDVSFPYAFVSALHIAVTARHAVVSPLHGVVSRHHAVVTPLHAVVSPLPAPVSRRCAARSPPQISLPSPPASGLAAYHSRSRKIWHARCLLSLPADGSRGLGWK